MRQAGFDDEMVWLLEDLFSRTLDGRNAKVMPDIETILGRRAEDFADYARRTSREVASQSQPARV